MIRERELKCRRGRGTERPPKDTPPGHLHSHTHPCRRPGSSPGGARLNPPLSGFLVLEPITPALGPLSSPGGRARTAGQHGS